MINGQNFFDQPVKNDLRTYDNIQKISVAQGDYYTTGSLLDYNCFKGYYKIIATDLIKEQFYRKSNPKSSCKYTNVFYYWKSKTKTKKESHFRFLTMNHEGTIIFFLM